MTQWSPEYRVTVNNVVSTSATLSGLTITSGRSSIYSQPIAGYCNLTLIETNLAEVDFDINDSVTIEVKNTSGVYVYLFGGFITDVSVTVQNSGSSAITQKINIIAVGALARLSRTIYTGNLPHEFDGDRISYLLALVLFDAWNEVPASTTWATYDPTVTWANAENSGYGEIDTPGDYELHSLTGLNDTIYNLASSAATSGLGYLYEDAQGRIGYADSTHRSEYLATNGYVDLDANHSIGPNLQIIKKSGDVRNSVTISYGATGSASVTDSDANSISLYGELAATIPTNLRNQVDAENQAAYYLEIRSYPQFELKQITFPLSSSEVDNSDRNALLNVFMGLPVNLSNLPSNMVDGSFQGFVEGWTWVANLNSLTLSLNVSPVAYSLQAMRWNSVPVTETWQTISPTLDWLNATIIA
jgi:hypothetical protein